MTEYVILRATNAAGTVFAVDGEESAGSPETAIRKWAARDQPVIEDEETPTSVYAACPKRSWTVAKITAQVTTQLKLETL